MDNKRVGFAESVYSDLSEHQSATHTNQILLNMSSYEELEYFMEARGLEQGPEALVAVLLGISLICGALLAHCMLTRQESGKGSETLQARKVLANVLNESLNQQQASEDGFVDVPLTDSNSTSQSQGYLGVQLDALTSEPRYMQAPTAPNSKRQKSAKQ